MTVFNDVHSVRMGSSIASRAYIGTTVVWTSYGAMSNSMEAPVNPSNPNWVANGSSSFTNDVEDSTGGLTAFTYSSVADGDYASASYSGVTVGVNYVLTLKVKTRNLTGSKAARLAGLAGLSVWFNIDNAAVTRESTGLSTTLSALGSGWVEVVCIFQPNTVSGSILFLVAESGTSDVETSGSFDVCDMELNIQ